MNKTILIFKHEFTTMIRRISFIIMTAAFPLLGLILIFGGQFISNITSEPKPVAEVKIGYVDAPAVVTGYQQQSNFLFVAYGDVETADKAMIDGNVSEFIVIAQDYVNSGIVTRFTLSRELQAPTDRQNAVRNFLLQNLLGPNVDPKIVDRAISPLSLSTVVIDPKTGLPATDQGGAGALLLPYLFSILLAMSIFTSSGYLLQGLAEEKENRIMEVLLSSVSSRQLITGKVLGLGAAGLAQMALWLISARFLASMASTNFNEMLGAIQISGTFIFLGLAYFILGYLLYAIIMAAVGSIGSTARESQQLAGIFSVLAVSPLWGLVFLIENPQHPFSVFLTLFPLTAPITTIIRVGAADVPIWQIATSMTLMMVSIVGLLLLAAKVFRAFLLMYGKTPKLGEIIRLLKQA
jgi:ABC-2 type transport system permease protein